MASKELIKQFHTVCSGLSDDEKGAIKNSYGHDSTKEFTDAELKDAIDKLSQRTVKKQYDPTLDKARKRTIAQIGQWLRMMHYEQSMDKIKAIACQAAKVDKTKFNSIPLAKLNNIQAAFRLKVETLATVSQVTEDQISISQAMN